MNLLKEVIKNIPEEEYNKLRQYNQMKRAIDKQNLERYDDYLK